MTGASDTDALVRYIVESLVDKPEAVSIVKNGEGHQAIYEVTVDAEDVGKVIGRQGRIIKAIRTLARAAAAVDGGDATVEIIG